MIESNTLGYVQVFICEGEQLANQCDIDDVSKNIKKQIYPINCNCSVNPRHSFSNEICIIAFHKKSKE